MNSGEVFLEVTSALKFARIPYMVVGSFASNLYGSGRGTFDIDIVISANPDQIRALLAAFPKDNYYYELNSSLEACQQKSMFNILDMRNGWKVDFIFEKPTPYHRQAFERRVPAEIERVPLFAATAEDVILSKLEWAQMGASQRQIEDVAGILRVRHDLLDMAYIEKWVKELGLSEQYAAARKDANLD